MEKHVFAHFPVLLTNATSMLASSQPPTALMNNRMYSRSRTVMVARDSGMKLARRRPGYPIRSFGGRLDAGIVSARVGMADLVFLQRCGMQISFTTWMHG